jgi:signal transduction histidine kinase/DNA-binding response OmpR family regulator
MIAQFLPFHLLSQGSVLPFFFPDPWILLSSSVFSGTGGGPALKELRHVRSYTLKSSLIMTSIDFVFMSILCYVLGLLLGVLPSAAAEYWTIVGSCYLAKTAIWLLLRIPLLLPIDRWTKRGMPADDNDPALIRSIYYFPYDFSVFYGVLVFFFYGGILWTMLSSHGAVQIGSEMLLPGLLFGGSIATGAVAIGVPVNLLLTAKFSRRLSERPAEKFSEIPGKQVSLQKKMGTVALALGCAPSLLLFGVQVFLQYGNLHQEASRTAVRNAARIKLEPLETLDRWGLEDVYPFVVEDGRVRFAAERRPASSALALLVEQPGQGNGSMALRERRTGYVVGFSQGTDRNRGVFVKIPEPRHHYLAISMVLLLACVWPLLASLLTVHTIVKPVSVIASLFHTIIGRGRAEEGDQVPIFYKDEVGRLAFNANRTLNTLTEARRQLERSAKDLEAKNAELKEAYRTKGQFLANMSHELRTPLNAIIGFSRLMKRKLSDTLPERQRKNLSLIEQSGEQLLVLVNDLLDFEKIEAGKLNIRREEMELGPFLESLEAILGPQAQEKGLELLFRTENLPNRISTDKDRLRQILTNLLTNSIKYSDTGTVSLTVKQQDDQLIFLVQDEGIGMTPEQVKLIFDPFHQVDASETRERGGVGLGLAIVGRLVGLFGGTITVTSEKGKGSTFHVTLPLQISTEHLRPEGVGADILAVDDNLDFLESIHSELTRAGFRVTVASSGLEALEILEKLRPKAILLDIVMPGMDGWELLRRIGEIDDLQGIPVVVTSVVDEAPVGLGLEIAGWLTKPFDPAALLEVLGGKFSADVTKGRLLIVEDDHHTSQLLLQTFAESGVDAHVVGTELDARRVLAEELPDVLVLDLTLGQGSGWSVLAHLKGLNGHEKTRVFVYTASDLDEKEREKLSDNLATLVQKHGKNSLSDLVDSIVGRC